MSREHISALKRDTNKPGTLDESIIARHRSQLAAALAHSARTLWRLKRMDDQDGAILDVLCEALVRLGQAHRLQAGHTPAQIVKLAPPWMAETFHRLGAVANVSKV